MSEQLTQSIQLYEQLARLVLSRDTDDYFRFRELFGATPLLVDDPTGHYPVRTHTGAELRAEVGERAINRLFFINGEHSDQRPPRQFRLRPDTVHAITIAPETTK